MDSERRLVVATGLNIGVTAGQVVAGIAAGSLGLLADAGHNLTDTGAVLLALVAVRLTRRPATSGRSWGWHRSGVLAAQANAAMLLIVTALLGYAAIARLLNPSPVDGAVVLVVALVAAALNGLGAYVVGGGHAHAGAQGGHEHATGGLAHGPDMNLRGATLHLLADALVSLGVAAAGLVILLTGGFGWLDPAVTIVVGVVIGAYAVRLLRESTEVLLESTPAGLDVDALHADALALPGVLELHDVHVWSISDRLRAASGHVLVDGHPSLEDARVVGEAVKGLMGAYGIAHATLELECEPCAPDCSPQMSPRG